MSRAALDKLLLHSYENYQVLFNHKDFVNHNAHHLGALYLLGANEETLEKAYKIMCDIVDPYDPSPHQITRSNWRNFLGDKNFCQAYKDFFEQELTNSGDDWPKKLLHLLLEDNITPMINGLVCSLSHPLIHVGYAFELNSRIVGIEALTLTAVCYTPFHKIIDQLRLPKLGTKSALEIFQDIQSDDRFALEGTDIGKHFHTATEELTDSILFHFNQWKINEDNLDEMIESLLDFSVYLYGATHKVDKIEFNFFLLHLLTGIHAIRVIYPHLHDQEVMGHVLLQYFYFAIVVYIITLRPEINKSLIDDFKLDDTKHNWDYVIDRTLNSNLVYIMHLVKAMYSLQAAERAYGFKNGLYLKTAVKTVEYVTYENPWDGASDNPDDLISLKHD